VDGITETTDTGFFHTACSAAQWFMIDFGVSRTIQIVSINNRQSEPVYARMNAAKIRVGDSATAGLNPLCTTIETAAANYRLSCSTPEGLTGRYLHVETTGVCLHFSEISAYSRCDCPEGSYDPITEEACVKCTTGKTSVSGSMGPASCDWITNTASALDHTRTGEACQRVCGNVTAAACGPRHFASATCHHAGYTLYECGPCAYAAGRQALPWSALDASACPSAPCAAGTYGANGECAPCARDTSSAAGSATCAPCARGTFSQTGSSNCNACFEDEYFLTQAGFGDAGVRATPGVLVVLNWPSSSHPVLVTVSTEVYWNSPVVFEPPPFAVNVDRAQLQTSFTIPEDLTGGALFYICEVHDSMGVNPIALEPAPPCAAGAVAARSVAAVDAYFARTAAAGHNASEHNHLYEFCHARGACLPCLPGESEHAGACVACDYAHYQPHFQAPRCFECAAGHNTSARGARRAADCRCQPGFE